MWYYRPIQSIISTLSELYHTYMSRRSNKWIAEILTPSSPSVEPTTNVCISSQSSIKNENIHYIELARKITIATEGFTTHKFCELVLKDRNRLSKENALTICDYVIAMKREVNPRLSYKRYTIQVLSELSKAVGIERKFIDMTRDDVLCYLDNCRKSENEDPMHKWIGTYNSRLVIYPLFWK
jgi:hypothetical protein